MTTKRKAARTLTDDGKPGEGQRDKGLGRAGADIDEAEVMQDDEMRLAVLQGNGKGADEDAPPAHGQG